MSRGCRTPKALTPTCGAWRQKGSKLPRLNRRRPRCLSYNLPGEQVMCKFIGSVLVSLLLFAVATAEEFTGVVTKFEDGKITIRKGGGGGPPDIVVLTVDAKCKFMKAKRNNDNKKFEADGELEGGKDAYARQVKDVADKIDKGIFGGVFTQIITTGAGDKATVTELRVIGFPKK